MSIASLAETHGLLQHDLVVWSEAHQDKWATNDHNHSPDHYAKKKKNLTPHTQPEPGLPRGQSIRTKNK